MSWVLYTVVHVITRAAHTASMLARAAQHRNDENDEHNDLNSCPDYLLKRWQQQRAFDASRQSSKWAFSCLAVVSWAAEHPVCLSIAQPSPSWGKGIRQKSRHHWQKTLSVTTFYSPLISSSSSFKWDFDLNFPYPCPTFRLSVILSSVHIHTYVSNGAKFEHRRLL